MELMKRDFLTVTDDGENIAYGRLCKAVVVLTHY